MTTPDDIAAIWDMLGFSPGSTRAVVLLPDAAIAVAADYPEPIDPPTQED